MQWEADMIQLTPEQMQAAKRQPVRVFDSATLEPYVLLVPHL